MKFNLQITDKGIFDLMTDSVSNSVEEVHVARCYKITDEAIECITLRASKLKNLLFDNCPNLTGINRSLKLINANIYFSLLFFLGAFLF